MRSLASITASGSRPPAAIVAAAPRVTTAPLATPLATPSPTPPSFPAAVPARRHIHHRRHHHPSALRATGSNNLSPQDDDARAQPLARGAVVSVDQFPGLEWRRATVIGNEAANVEGSYRLLRISVPDDVPRLSGLRMEGRVVSGERWVDHHTSPGQLVGLRLPAEGERAPSPLSAAAAASPPGPRLYPLACTPYETRRDSASIGASLIEVAVSRRLSGGSNNGNGNGSNNSSSAPSSPSARGAAARAEHEAALAELGPGDEVEVSGVVGRGFASLFSSSATLLAALEERRPLLLVASGLRGAALMRAALSWTPVQAHATAAGVCAYYLDDSPSRAAFVAQWDGWREAGVRFTPLFLRPPGGAEDASGEAAAQPSEFASAGGGGGGGKGGSDDGDQASAIADLIEQALFVRAGGLEGALGGPPQEAAALLAGLPGKVSSAVSRELSYKGVMRERILFVDFL